MENMFSNNIKDIAENYLLEKEKKYANSNIAHRIRYELPKCLADLLKNDDEYICLGSPGKGRFVEIPWVGIFYKAINAKPRKGIYLVFLFSSDMKKIYLSINQGYEYFQSKYNDKKGKKIAKDIVNYLRNNCYTIEEQYMSQIDLKAKGLLGKGYEAANICSIKYDTSNFPKDETIHKDITKMIAIYTEIIDLINKREIEEFYNYILAKIKGQIVDNDYYKKSIDIFIGEIDKSNDIPQYRNTPKEKRQTIRDYAGHQSYPRDVKVAANSLAISNYRCENNFNHKFFIRKSTSKNYTESHHLIPLSKHGEFEYSLDVEENICSLCSICHDCIHYGSDKEKEKILKKLYDMRIELLKKACLDISFEKLKSYYLKNA